MSCKPALQTDQSSLSFVQQINGESEVKSLSRVRLCATPWTAAYQAPPPMGFSRQEYWSGVDIAFSAGEP